MAEINFVADPGNQQPKQNDPGEERVAWSEAEKQAPKPGLLSFLQNKPSATPGSRDEALQMIKSYVKEKEKAPLDSVAPPVAPSVPVPGAKPVGRILEMKQHDDGAPLPMNNKQLQNNTDQAAVMHKTGGFTDFFKKLFAKKTKHSGGHILATDLISGEITTVFDWRKNIPVFIFWLIFSGLILAGSFQGLVVWEEKKVAEANTNTEKFGALRIQIAQEEKGVDEILDLQKNLEVIKKLLDRHIYWSNFFSFLERNTLADVAFGGFAGDTKGLYALNGAAKDFKTLADQLTTFKSDKVVTWVGSRGGSAGIDKSGDGSIAFSLELLVKKELFNRETEQTKKQ
jgi:hypothetical protein